MSAIPPNAISSVLQSGSAQQHRTQVQDAEENQRKAASRELTGGPDAILEVEATDGDTRVDTDSGGLGSQGRYDAAPEEEVASDASEAPRGITVDPGGVIHLDISA